MKNLIFIILAFIGCANPNFISLQSGDCVDRAVVKRQELRQQGYEAELVVGVMEYKGEMSMSHMWVKYKDKQTGEWKQIYNY